MSLPKSAWRSQRCCSTRVRGWIFAMTSFKARHLDGRADGAAWSWFDCIWRAAFEVRGVVRVSFAFVCRDPGIRTERARSVDDAVDRVRGDNPLRCDAALDPILQRRQHVE